MPGPLSYTGEDVAELHVHGGAAVVEAVIGAALRTRICRIAEPGEFTRRAFDSGRMDLTQAEAVPVPALGETEAVLDGIAAALRRIGAGLVSLRPAGELTAATVGRDHEMYFVLREQAEALRRSLAETRETWEAGRRDARKPALVSGTRVQWPWSFMTDLSWGQILSELAAAQDIGLYLADLAEQARPLDPGREWLRQLAGDAAVLDLLAREAARPGGQHAVLYAHVSDPSGQGLLDQQLAVYQSEPFLPAVEDGPRWWAPERALLTLPGSRFTRGAVTLRGLGAEHLARFEEGSHLIEQGCNDLTLIHVHVLPVPDGDAPEAVVARIEARRGDWLAALARGGARIEDDPLAPPPVVRIEGRSGWLDLRTGLRGTGAVPVTELIRAMLPMVAEVSTPPPSPLSASERGSRKSIDRADGSSSPP